MLKGLHPLISPPLLAVLAEMGHGDELAIIDANFPAATVARRLVHMPGLPAPAALEAVLTLLPLDDFVSCPAAIAYEDDLVDAAGHGPALFPLRPL